jgi:hypothetical protein
MKLALVERLDVLVTAAQRLQRILDAERPNVPYSVFLLCRLGIDADEAVGKLEHHVRTLGGKALRAK